MTRRTTRHAARAASASLVTALLMLPTSPAWAVVTIDDGEEPDPLAVVPSLLVFVGIPLLVLLAIAAAVYGPSALRGPRYRPQQGWDHEPMWFAGPADPEGAVARASEQPGRGGASASW